MLARTSRRLLSTTTSTPRMSIYSLKVKDAQGVEQDLSQYKGHVSLVVNVASSCGYTSKNYKKMQALYEKLKDKGFVVLAFPCNQFWSQEPEACPIIQKNMKDKFGVSFPIFDKIEVNGDNTAEIYQILKAALPGKIGWNFEKFLVDKDGKPVKRWKSSWSSEIEEEVEKML